MEDATTIICELHAKLTELDDRIVAYRIDMAKEFTRYQEKLLQNVPEDVSHRVRSSLAGSLSNYPSLSPPTSRLDSSCSSTPIHLDSTPINLDSSAEHSREPPLPNSHPTPATHQEQPERPRSPHQREQEFRGLFTPTFLPLLESTDRPQHSPPPSPKVVRSIDARLSTGNAEPSESPQELIRPSPRRRTSHGTTSSIDSVGSDSSTSKFRKSALKTTHSRSSSASKPITSPRSPRRVRFDFEGEEVLPSSSPQPVPTILHVEGGSAPELETPVTTDDSYISLSLGDIEGEEEGLPVKKVSSSQALRELSKRTLDDGTVWTVVNSNSDLQDSPTVVAPEVDTRTATTASGDTVDLPTMPPKQLPERPKVQAVGKATDQKPKAVNRAMEDENDDSEEDSTLFMISKKEKKKPAPAQARRLPSPVPSEVIPMAARSTTPTAPPPHPSVVKLNEGHPKQDDHDDDDLFVLDAADDDESLMKVTSKRSTPKKHVAQVAEEETEEEKPEPVDKYDPTELPASPPLDVPLPRPSVTLPEALRVKPVPPKVIPAPRGPMPAVSIGSYKGTSFSMGPLKDVSIQEQALADDAEAPAFFVGSVNGRSGPDASNSKSWGASLQSPTNTGMPGSLTERLLRDRMRKGNDDSDDDEKK